MILNPIQGQIPTGDQIIYAAADTVYFDLYARALIVSASRNMPHLGVHIHIYNPTEAQLSWASSQNNLTCTWETTNDKDLKNVAKYWPQRTDLENPRQHEMQKKSRSMSGTDFLKLVHNTYYACARFVRLAEILPEKTICLSLDVDGLIRKKFAMDFESRDIYLYEKPKDHTHLAGALLFQPNAGCRNFLTEYAQSLRNSLEQNDIYWFLDQITLDRIVPKYNKGLLPMSYIDWAMRADSAIWSAKGKRKELDIFRKELNKYQS